MYQTYTVKRGDTIYGISNQFGVEAIDIYNLNNLTSTNIQIGQILKIPNIQGNNPANLFTYTVKKGDSLYNIAKRYDTTVEKIVKLNHLTSTNLSIGQTLSIPESGYSVQELPSYINYVVKKGDSLYQIAKAYNTTVDNILKDNNLNSTNLSIGQILKIRTNKNEEAIEECFGESYTPTPQEKTYTVIKGDSLWKIAQKFNTTVNEIKKKNNLNTNNLMIGQVLKI